MENSFAREFRMPSSSPGERSEGVPPPKKTVSYDTLSCAAADRREISRARAVRNRFRRGVCDGAPPGGAIE